MKHKRIICIDVETFGMVRNPFRAEHFHPQRSIRQTGVCPEDLVLTCSVTEMGFYDPSIKLMDQLAGAGPQDTRVYTLSKPIHQKMLVQWLQSAAVLVGFNLLYDVGHLRATPICKYLLGGSHFLVDASMLNAYLHEGLAYHSLKDLCVIRGLALTDWSEPGDLPHYDRVDDPDLLYYNAMDTHMTAALTADLCREIQADKDRETEKTLSYMSDSLWSSLRMTEAGIPFSTSKLKGVKQAQEKIRNENAEYCLSHDLILAGKGSNISKWAFMEDKSKGTYFQHYVPKYKKPGLAVLTKKGRISWKDVNRNLLSVLVDDDLTKDLLEAGNKHAHASKLLSSYVDPLLEDGLGCAIPTRKNIRIAFPIWFPARGPTKDTSGSGSVGGTSQCRLAAKNPAGQTFSPVIQDCQTSRYDRGVLLTVDLSQIEMRTAGLLAKDLALIEAYQKGEDLHTGLAMFAEGEDILKNPYFGLGDRVLDPRQWYKQANFLMLYRGGATRLQATLLALTGRLFSIQDCRNMVQSTQNRYAGVMEWHLFLQDIVRKEGRLVLPITGHSRNLDPTKLTDISNFPVQTTAAILMGYIQGGVHKRLPSLSTPNPPVRLIQVIHDSVVLDCESRDVAADIEALVIEAIQEQATSGYWAKLKDLQGIDMPLEWSTKIKE